MVNNTVRGSVHGTRSHGPWNALNASTTGPNTCTYQEDVGPARAISVSVLFLPYPFFWATLATGARGVAAVVFCAMASMARVEGVPRSRQGGMPRTQLQLPGESERPRGATCTDRHGHLGMAHDPLLGRFVRSGHKGHPIAPDETSRLVRSSVSSALHGSQNSKDTRRRVPGVAWVYASPKAQVGIPPKCPDPVVSPACPAIRRENTWIH